MFHLKKILQIWDAGDHSQDHSQNCGQNGPNWLIDPVEQPKEVEIYGAEESDVKKKAVKEIFKVGMKKDDKHQHQILNFNLKLLKMIKQYQ